MDLDVTMGDAILWSFSGRQADSPYHASHLGRPATFQMSISNIGPLRSDVGVPHIYHVGVGRVFDCNHLLSKSRCTERVLSKLGKATVKFVLSFLEL